MRDLGRQGQVIAIAIAAAALGLMAWYHWSITRPPADATTTAQKACLQSVARTYKPLMMANALAEVARAKKLFGGLKTTPSEPDADTRLAQNDYADRVDNIRTSTAFCNDYAKCFQDKSRRTVFSACYETMTSKPDDADDLAPDQDQN